MQKQRRSFVPADDVAEEALERVKYGDLVLCDIIRPRNLKHHQKYWVMIGLVWDSCDQKEYPTRESLHIAIKVLAGERDPIYLPNDLIAYLPRSINFNTMDQDQFSDYYKRALDVVQFQIIPGLDIDELESEIMDFL